MQWFGAASFGTVKTTMAPMSDNIKGFFANMTPERARQLVEYHTAEQNRILFGRWALVQIPIALLVLVLMLFATNGNRPILWLSVALFLTTLIQYWVLTPQVALASHAFDFTSAEDNIQERALFWGHHRAYVVADLFKIGTALLLGFLASRGPRTPQRFAIEAEPEEKRQAKRRRKHIPMAEFPKHQDPKHQD